MTPQERLERLKRVREQIHLDIAKMSADPTSSNRQAGIKVLQLGQVSIMIDELERELS
jgi:hypothetical protein